LAREGKTVAALRQHGAFRHHHGDSLPSEAVENAVQLRKHAQIENRLFAEKGFQSLLRIGRNHSRSGVGKLLRQERQQTLVASQSDESARPGAPVLRISGFCFLGGVEVKRKARKGQRNRDRRRGINS